jgi:hypothetical protein
MSDPNGNYAAIRQTVEKKIVRQKWLYRVLFFVVHLIFYGVTMAAVWGTMAADTQLRDLLFNNQPGAAAIVLLPTILWTLVVLFHVASLYFESSAGEKAIRERVLLREVGEEMLRKGLVDEQLSEKPKRRADGWETERARLSDDGEIIPVDGDERFDHVRTHRAGDS